MTYDTKKGREKKEKFLNLDADSLNDHIKKLENEILIAKECLKYVEGKNVPTGEQRKNFLFVFIIFVNAQVGGIALYAFFHIPFRIQRPR